ncbi:MAG TPA: hypothetical protein VJM46_01030 [Candidatus Saccharimonadales bacterium]|nr:hypothetical protein [Candidatus Saccharimonadales bacterium]
METAVRKTFESAAEALAAQRAESFIAGQTHGAGTWQDQTEVPIQSVVPGAVLRITDKVGTDRGGPLRHIELRRADRVIVTFVYSHFTHQLVRTF